MMPLESGAVCFVSCRAHQSVAHDLRHYLDGYINLANFAVERQRVMEIKTVAEYIHFKVTSALFESMSLLLSLVLLYCSLIAPQLATTVVQAVF
jgi:hypothetical protein